MYEEIERDFYFLKVQREREREREREKGRGRERYLQTERKEYRKGMRNRKKEIHISI